MIKNGLAGSINGNEEDVAMNLTSTQFCGMMRCVSRQGFTLIELLVVILIIGILAAIALPQYQKSVVRSQLAMMKGVVNPVAQAAEMYYLTNGVYPSRFGELDVKIPAPKKTSYTSNHVAAYETYSYEWGSCSVENGFGKTAGGKTGQYLVYCYGKNIGYLYYMTGTKMYPLGPACWAKGSLALSICYEETGTKTPYYVSSYFSYSKKVTP